MKKQPTILQQKVKINKKGESNIRVIRKSLFQLLSDKFYETFRPSALAIEMEGKGVLCVSVTPDNDLPDVVQLPLLRSIISGVISASTDAEVEFII